MFIKNARILGRTANEYLCWLELDLAEQEQELDQEPDLAISTLG